jgi:hypothetical protein
VRVQVGEPGVMMHGGTLRAPGKSGVAWECRLSMPYCVGVAVDAQLSVGAWIAATNAWTKVSRAYLCYCELQRGRGTGLHMHVPQLALGAERDPASSPTSMH